MKGITGGDEEPAVPSPSSAASRVIGEAFVEDPLTANTLRRLVLGESFAGMTLGYYL